ncbi:aromatic ring-hydroxylating dioxygenase subunit alpha [Nocardia sp. BMG111209]|uniref:aromatic ring-hydroxylating oxygenase subunit alpha n=1 Tax=Nocardia sp. BMG111209 TaxID=1160137 RepID=UPI00035F85E6|nr:aromatic ring-hydroxylating dioxygenase subunit alpha [Nocardia sp. BMG111209]
MTTAHTAAQPLGGNHIAAGPLTEPPAGRALLPARAYTGEDEFRAEQRLVFGAGWVWAGYAHWLAEPGAVHPVTVAGQPLLLVRDEQQRIRVFHNACRHRGMTLTEEPTVVRKRIQCAYHCWSFGLDGKLCAAPFYGRAKGSAVAAELGDRLALIPVAAHVWAGLIFVDLAAADADPQACAADFTDRLAPLLRRWSHIAFDRLHPVEERRFDIAANWKLVVENFLDFYHLPFIHPQVGPVAAALDIDDLVLRPDIMGGSYPRGAVGKTGKTEKRLPWLGDLPADLLERQDIFCVFPNALLFLEADWFQVIGFDPLAPGRTLEHMAVFVDRTAAGAEFAGTRTQLAEALFAVNEQDLPILRRLQAGRHSPAADATNLVAAWDQITALFQQRVADRAGYR